MMNSKIENFIKNNDFKRLNKYLRSKIHPSYSLNTNKSIYHIKQTDPLHELFRIIGYSNQPNYIWCSFIHLSIIFNAYECTRYLVSVGAHIDLKSKPSSLGLNPIQLAIIYKHHRMVRVLLKYHVSTDVQFQGYTLLDLSFIFPNLKIMNLLLDPIHSVNLNNIEVNSPQGNELMIMALRENNQIIIDFLLSQNFNINRKCSETLLEKVIIMRSLEPTDPDYPLDLLEKIIKLGANVNLRNGAPLYLSAKNCLDYEGMKLLIEHDAIPNVKSQKCSPLHAVLRHRNLEGDIVERAIKLLVNKGFDINELDSSGYTPLQCYMKIMIYNNLKRGFRILKKLLKNGANIDVEPPPIIIFSQIKKKDKSRYFKRFKEMGFDLNQTDENCESVIHGCITSGDLESIKYLTTLNDLSLDSCSTIKGTPLQYSIRVGFYEAADQLLLNLADTTKLTLSDTILYPDFTTTFKLLFLYGFKFNEFNNFFKNESIKYNVSDRLEVNEIESIEDELNTFLEWLEIKRREILSLAEISSQILRKKYRKEDLIKLKKLNLDPTILNHLFPVYDHNNRVSFKRKHVFLTSSDEDTSETSESS